MDNGSLRPVCLVLSIGALLLGVAGMALSFLFLTSNSPADFRAGASGFTAGAILIGAGLISLTILASRPTRSKRASNRLRDLELD